MCPVTRCAQPRHPGAQLKCPGASLPRCRGGQHTRCPAYQVASSGAYMKSLFWGKWAPFWPQYTVILSTTGGAINIYQASQRSVGASENVHPLKTIFGSSMTGAWLGEVQPRADSNTTVNSAPGNPPLHTLPGPSACTLRRFWVNFFSYFSNFSQILLLATGLHLARFLSLCSTLIAKSWNV